MMLLLWLACSPEPEPFDAACGDGLVSAGEVCDDGLNDGAYGGCEAGCAARAPYCGDGEVDEGEGCDDGLNDGAYGSCTYDCAAESGFCGDGEVNGPEACDDGTNEGGYGGCKAGCAALGPWCGDGQVHASEACDDGTNDGVCGSCTGDCQAEATAPQLVEIIVRALGGSYGWPVDTPDVFIEIYDADDNLLLVTPAVEDRDVPVSFAIEGLLTDGATWTVHVWDEDGGTFGDDDDMGEVFIDTSEPSGTETREGTRVSWTVEERTCD